MISVYQGDYCSSKYSFSRWFEDLTTEILSFLALQSKCFLVLPQLRHLELDAFPTHRFAAKIKRSKFRISIAAGCKLAPYARLR